MFVHFTLLIFKVPIIDWSIMCHTVIKIYFLKFTTTKVKFELSNLNFQIWKTMVIFIGKLTEKVYPLQYDTKTRFSNSN